MKSPTLPIVLGLTLCTVGGAILYVYWKKRKEDEVDTGLEGEERLKTNQIQSAEIILPNRVIPLVMGRKGITLKHIEETSCTRIEFKENREDRDTHICIIKGTSDGIEQAASLIKKEATRPPTMIEEVMVPQTACGRILGRCGEILHEICRKSMAKVSIDPSSGKDMTTNRRILITGTKAQINVARSLIEEKVREDNEARKTQELVELRREPRIKTPPTSITATPIPREVLPQTVEKLRSTSSSGLLEVFVSAVISPNQFYLQLVGPQSAELDILVDAMTEYYNQPENRQLHKIREPYLGQIVAAELMADNKWYRAEIIAILPNELNNSEILLDLYFVDYGDNQYIKPSDVYELRPDFLALRFQAIECFLAHVEPNNEVSSTNSDLDEEWDVQAVNRFEELSHAARWRKLLSKIATYKKRTRKGSREGSPIAGVELYDTTIDGVDVNIALELVNEGYARMSRKFGDLAKSHILNLDGYSSSVHSSADNLHKEETDEHLVVSTTSKEKPKENGVKVNGAAKYVRDGDSINDNPINGSKTGEDEVSTTKPELLTVDENKFDENITNSKATIEENAANEVSTTKTGFLTRDWNEIVKEEEEMNGNLSH